MPTETVPKHAGALVTIAVPVYKRLEYLPGVLQAIAAQDYSEIELVVSDNGQNGSRVTEIVDRYYPRPYRLRRNPTTVDLPSHYHQLLAEASGEYFLWLADDDSISPNFVSELVRTLGTHRDVSVAIARQEVMDTSGRVVRRSADEVPEFLTGDEFVLAWTRYGYENYSTVLARTKEIRECGGWAHFPRGTASDDALLIRLCTRGRVAFNTRCTFLYRWHDTSYGFSISARQLAHDLSRVLRFLDTDPVLLAYSRREPQRWRRMRRALVQMTWTTYLHRWRTLYRPRLSTVEWVSAGFAMPFIPRYYRAVAGELWNAAIASSAQVMRFGGSPGVR